MDTKQKLLKMLDMLLNEEHEKMDELFHEVVIDKSRAIYEHLLSEEELPEMGYEDEDMIGGDEQDNFVDDITADEEGLSLEDAAEELGDEMGLDANGDEFGGDDDMDFDEPADDEEIEDRLVDVEKSLDDLEAKFAKLLGDEEVEHGMDYDDDGELGGDDVDMDVDMDMDDDDDFAEESVQFEDEEVDESDEQVDEDDDLDEDALDEEVDSIVREYVDHVKEPSNSEEPGTYTKSPNAGKNTVVSDNGSGAHNLNQGKGNEKGRPDPSHTEDDAGNINKPGAKSSSHTKSAPKPDLGDHASNKKSVVDKIRT